MPRYKGDLELINHQQVRSLPRHIKSVGCERMSCSPMLLKKASVAAAWLAGVPIRRTKLNNAWTLGDGWPVPRYLTGNCHSQSVWFAWNDDVIAMESIRRRTYQCDECYCLRLEHASQRGGNVVLQPLNIPREDNREAAVAFPQGVPKAVRVIGPMEMMCPRNSIMEVFCPWPGRLRLVSLFTHVQAAEAPGGTTLRRSGSSLENNRYRVSIDSSGDVSSIFDKKINPNFFLRHPFGYFNLITQDNGPAWKYGFEDEHSAPRTS